MLTVAGLRVGRLGDLIKRYTAKDSLLLRFNHRRTIISTRFMASADMGSLEKASNGQMSVHEKIALITKNLQVSVGCSGFCQYRIVIYQLQVELYWSVEASFQF